MTEILYSYDELLIKYQEYISQNKHEEIILMYQTFIKNCEIDAEKKLRLKTALAVSLNKVFRHSEVITLLENNEVENFSYSTKIQYYFTLVDTYYSLVDTENAYRYTILALKLANNETDIDKIGVAYNYLGSIYNLLDDNQNAVINFIKCLKIYKNNQVLDRSMLKIAVTYNNLAYCLSKLNKLIWAKSCINSSISINKKHIQSNDIYLYSYLYLTRIHIRLKEYPIAKNTLNKATRIFSNINNLEKTFEIQLLEFNILLLQKKNIKRQLHLLNELEKLSYKIMLSNKLLSFYELASIYYHLNEDYKNAFLYKEKYVVLEQKINKTAIVNKTKQIQIKYEIEKVQIEKEKVEYMAAAKHDFLMHISHEIRTPLNIINGALNLIDSNNIINTQQKYIDIALKGSSNLLNLINDILDLAKIEVGKFTLTLEPVCIHDLLNQVVSLFEIQAKQKNIILNIQNDTIKNEWIIGDNKRLQQILINLLSNALKFTHKGEIKIHAIIINNQLQIDVTDTGRGIKKQDIAHLFQSYQSFENSNSQKIVGTGLGLSITKKLCLLMKGDLLLLKSNSKGSVFRVELPIQKAKNKTTQKAKNNVKLNNNLKIIIADDIKENRIIIRDLLLKNNNFLIVHEAIDGKDLLSKVTKQSYQVILVDLDMPIMNGFQFIEKLKAKKINSKVIAMTASILTISKKQIVELGFDELILKPFNPNELINLIAQVESFH